MCVREHRQKEGMREAAPAAAPFWTKLRFNANCFWATEEGKRERPREPLCIRRPFLPSVPSSHCPTLISQLGSLLRLILFLHLILACRPWITEIITVRAQKLINSCYLQALHSSPFWGHKHAVCACDTWFFSPLLCMLALRSHPRQRLKRSQPLIDSSPQLGRNDWIAVE